MKQGNQYHSGAKPSKHGGHADSMHERSAKGTMATVKRVAAVSQQKHDGVKPDGIPVMHPASALVQQGKD